MISYFGKALSLISFILTCKMFESGFKMISLSDSLIIFKCLFAIIFVENSFVFAQTINTYERFVKTFTIKEKNTQKVEYEFDTMNDFDLLDSYYF